MYPTGCGPLGLVASQGVSVVKMSVVEVPGGNGPGEAVSVEADGDSSALGVDLGDGTQVAVEDAEAAAVLEADDPVAGLERSLFGTEPRPAQVSRRVHVRSGPLVEQLDGRVVVGEK